MSDVKENNFFVFNDEVLIGGAIGYIEHNWYFLDVLYVDEGFRKQGIVSDLLKRVEYFAKSKNLTGIRTETWDFQAEDFYLNNGFIVFAKIRDCPPGTIEYQLKKELF